MPRTAIGITCDFDGKNFFTRPTYCRAVRAAGGVPLVLPMAPAERIADMLQHVGGVLLIGSMGDVPPRRYNQAPLPATHKLNRAKEDFDFALMAQLANWPRPILAVCYGSQLLNVALGGSLHQDIPTQLEVGPWHAAGFDESRRHMVRIKPRTRLRKILGAGQVEVNSTHHQAIDRIAPSLGLAAVSDDGVTEAVEARDAGRFLIGVQWHPERLIDNQPHLRLFQAFIEEAGK